jgi:hypothetical protein
MVHVADETPESPPVKKALQRVKPRTAAGRALTELAAASAASESMKHLGAELAAASAASESMKHLGAELANLAGVTKVAESIKRLTEIARPVKPVQIPTLDPALLQVIERPEVRLLREVHGELEGMALLLAESARQMGAMAEVTKANLTALETVVGELQQSRRAAAWSNGVLIALTVAVLLATVVGAIAVEQEFSRQLAAFWNWVQGLGA